MSRISSPAFLLPTLVLVPSFLILGFASFEGPRLINFFPDDAFYYLQVAQNYVSIGLLSFDGENTTTGFHPLQMLLSVAALSLMSKEGALTFFFLLNPLCYAASLLILVRLFALKWPSLLLASVAASAIFTIHIFAASAMESGLIVVTASAFFYAFVKSIEKSDFGLKRSLVVGVFAGLLFLSRLDMVVPLFVLGLIYLVVLLRARSFSSLFFSLAAFLVVVGPYFWWMYQVQGSFLPVSSLAKYGRSESDFRTTWVALTGNNLIGISIFVLSLVPLVAGALYLALGRSVAKVRSDLPVLGILISGVCYLIYTFFFAQEAFRWYLTYPSIVSAFVVLFLVSRVDPKKIQPRIKLVYAIPALVFVLNCAVMITYFRYETVTGSLYETTLDLNERVPPNSKLGTHDAGVVGYFSTSRVHNLDGLVNSKANLLAFLRDRKLIAYAIHYKLEYLLVRESLLPSLQAEAEQKRVSLQIIASYDVTRMARVKLIKVQTEQARSGSR